MGTKATHIDHDIYARALVLNDGTSRLAIVSMTSTVSTSPRQFFGRGAAMS
jgi:hypothetical protein